MEAATKAMGRKGEQESMLAAHVPDEAQSLTLEQLRGALMGSPPGAEPWSPLLDELRGVLAPRSPCELPPGSACALPMKDQAVDQTLDTDYEVLKRKKDVLRINPADHSIRDFNQDISARLDGEAARATNGDSATTVARHDVRVTDAPPSHMNNGYHVKEGGSVLSPVRARAASVLPDVSIPPLAPGAGVAAPAAAAPAPARPAGAASVLTGTGTPRPAAPRSPHATPVAPGTMFTSTPRVSVTPAVTSDARDDSPYDDNRLLVEVQNPDRKNGADLPRGFKRKLQSFLQVQRGKNVSNEEMETLLVGPTYDKETLDEDDLLQEFVQVAVTTVFEPAPRSRLRAALPAPPRVDDTPASFILHVTKAAKVSCVRVHHAAARPDSAPFQRHEFRGAGASCALAEPASVRAVQAHAARMREARAALARAAARLARQLQVVCQLTLPRREAGLEARLGAGPEAGPEAGLEARLPARTLAEFQRLDADLKASAALRDELMRVYRAVAGAARSSWEGIRGILERTLQPPVDAHYSGSGRAYRGVQKADYSATVPYACLRDIIKEKFEDKENLGNLRSRVGQWLSGKNDRAAAS